MLEVELFILRINYRLFVAFLPVPHAPCLIEHGVVQHCRVLPHRCVYHNSSSKTPAEELAYFCGGVSMVANTPRHLFFHRSGSPLPSYVSRSSLRIAPLGGRSSPGCASAARREASCASCACCRACVPIGPVSYLFRKWEPTRQGGQKLLTAQADENATRQALKNFIQNGLPATRQDATWKDVCQRTCGLNLNQTKQLQELQKLQEQEEHLPAAISASSAGQMDDVDMSKKDITSPTSNTHITPKDVASYFGVNFVSQDNTIQLGIKCPNCIVPICV